MSFRVPELLRITSGPMGTRVREGNYGAFEIPYEADTLFVIATDGLDDTDLGPVKWEHVSIHGERSGLSQRNMFIPTWTQMCYVKDLFWEPEDVVLQLHPKKSEYINLHPYTLHLWKPIDFEFPTPPGILVG